MKTTVAANTSYLRGFDISQFQPTVDWTQVAGENFAFCTIRASHGGQADTMFASHRAGAKSINLPTGFYHYLNPAVSVDTQVKNFIQVVGSLNPGDLGIFVDVESPDAWAPIARKDRLGLIIQWCDAVEKGLGVRPEVYCSLNFINQVLADPAVDLTPLGEHELWIAEYGLKPGVNPTLPGLWTAWKFWQYADNTTVAGISGGVDGDYFNGTRADLEKLRVPALATTPVSSSDPASMTAKACARSLWPRKRPNTPAKRPAARKKPATKKK